MSGISKLSVVMTQYQKTAGTKRSVNFSHGRREAFIIEIVKKLCNYDRTVAIMGKSRGQGFVMQCDVRYLIDHRGRPAQRLAGPIARIHG
nr:hypothetical protein [uncultured Sulfitobacter sp.]